MRLAEIIVFALASAACAKPIKKLKRQSIEDTYDFIIAGGMLLMMTTLALY